MQTNSSLCIGIRSEFQKVLYHCQSYCAPISSLARLSLFTYLFVSVNHLGLAMVLPKFPKLSYHGEIDENPGNDVLNKVTVEWPPKKSV